VQRGKRKEERKKERKKEREREQGGGKARRETYAVGI
jgi:hypothetical protein